MSIKHTLLAAFSIILLVMPRASLAVDSLEIEEGVKAAIENTELSGWQELFSALPDEVRTLWGDDSLYNMMSDYALGQSAYLGEELLEGIVRILLSYMPQMLPTLISLIAVALLSGFLRAMAEAGMAGLNDIVGFVCQCFAIGIAMASFLSLALLARDSIVKTSRFIELAFPVLLTLLTAAGGLASSGIYQPAMVMLSSGVSIALQGVVLPVILAGGALGVINNLTERVQLNQLFQLSKTAAKWIIGLLFTLYFSVTSLQGLTAATFDGISIRTAKFAMDKMIPLVGGMVSGTVDTVLGCAMLVKNAAGVTAIALAFSIVVLPLLRIAAGMLSFRLAAALCEPIGETRLPKMLASLADILTYLFAATVTLSIMFIITVGLIIGTGNAAIMGG